MTTLFSVSWKDMVKGLVTAVLAVVVVSAYQMTTGNSPIDWHQLGHLALASGLGYLVKNFFTDANGKLLGVL